MIITIIKIPGKVHDDEADLPKIYVDDDDDWDDEDEDDDDDDDDDDDYGHDDGHD